MYEVLPVLSLYICSTGSDRLDQVFSDGSAVARAGARRRGPWAVPRPETTSSREDVLDGAWWPRARHVETEPPSLISVRTEFLGPRRRVGVISWPHRRDRGP
ncbi:DUF5994 family protein [Streptomyces sp. NPDC057052]|uniref:DUF5994 family protein n=1 Tax=Streptomyces sp. NPDC057052 TaxID=3346010 RepID=UPI00362B9015